MAEFLSPGVYTIEESSGIKPIEAVGTSTAAFIGVTEKGPVDTPVLITSFSEFVNTFGSFLDHGFLALSVYQFFMEGGSRCFVVRTVHHDDMSVKCSTPAAGSTAFSGVKFEAGTDGTWANGTLDATNKVVPGTGLEIDIYRATIGTAANGFFRMDVYYKKDPKKEQLGRLQTGIDERKLVESYDELTLNTLADRIAGSAYVKLAAGSTPGSVGTLPEKTSAINITFTGGKAGIFENELANPPLNANPEKFVLTKIDFIGNTVGPVPFGFRAFDTVDEINNLAVPDASLIVPVSGNDPSPDLGEVMREGIVYCETRGDCFFIAYGPDNIGVNSIIDFKSNAMLSSSYGALYYPWLKATNPQSGATMSVPPAGVIAGIYANTDIKVGVHKAPAGQATGKLVSVNGVSRMVTKGEQDLLNPNGINAIRPFPNAGIIVWGARTLSPDAEWRYINIRRLFLMVEESLDAGSQWVVFEPNSPSLWGTVKRNLTAFLTGLWRTGALFGTTPEEAFYVKVDAENNPPAERDAGHLNIEVGIAPVRPAEFVVIRISQKTLTA